MSSRTRGRASDSSQGSKKLDIPTTTLPPEILSEIFVNCLPKDLNLTGRVDEAPVNVSQVCRRWREIALSTTRLWSTLVFFIGKTESHPHPTPDKGRQNMTVDAWRLWCRRSKGQPLSVFLRRTKGKFHGDIRRYFSTICSLGKKTRWKELCLSLPHTGNGVRVLALSPESFGQLEVLCLTNMFITFDSQAPFTLGIIKDEDDFKELTGQIVTVPSRLRVLSVKMRMPEQWILNAEEYDAFDYRMMMSILNGASPHLTYFGFSISARLFIFRDYDFDFGHVTLPNLRTMKLHDNDCAAGFFLDHITAPTLETLWLSFRRESVGGDSDMTEEELEYITGFLARSKAPITDFKVCIDGFDGENIREILRLVPQVQHLRINVTMGGIFGNANISDAAISFFRDLQNEGICLELGTVNVNVRLIIRRHMFNTHWHASSVFTIPFPLSL